MRQKKAKKGRERIEKSVTVKKKEKEGTENNDEKKGKTMVEGKGKESKEKRAEGD